MENYTWARIEHNYEVLEELIKALNNDLNYWFNEGTQQVKRDFQNEPDFVRSIDVLAQEYLNRHHSVARPEEQIAEDARRILNLKFQELRPWFDCVQQQKRGKKCNEQKAEFVLEDDPDIIKLRQLSELLVPGANVYGWIQNTATVLETIPSAVKRGMHTRVSSFHLTWESLTIHPSIVGNVIKRETMAIAKNMISDIINELKVEKWKDEINNELATWEQHEPKSRINMLLAKLMVLKY